MLEIGIGVFLKKSNKKKKNMENKIEKYVLRRQIKSEGIHERILEKIHEKSIK